MQSRVGFVATWKRSKGISAHVAVLAVIPSHFILWPLLFLGVDVEGGSLGLDKKH